MVSGLDPQMARCDAVQTIDILRQSRKSISTCTRVAHVLCTRFMCTRQCQPKKYISAQRDMMDLKGGLFVFETKMTLDRS